MIYTVNNNQINTDTREVICQGRVKNVEPLIFQLLVFMLGNPDRVLTREELIERVWNSRYISDSALSAAISTARQVIGDNGKLQHCIKTVSGSGYRFIAPFTKATKTSKTTEATKSAEDKSSPLETITVTKCDPFYTQPQEKDYKPQADPKFHPPEIPQKPSLAVMDFIDISRNQEASLLAFGLTAEINSALARYPHLFVIARASAGNLSKLELTAKVVGEHLGVRYLVYGKLQQVANRLRVMLSIVDACTDTEIWSEHFEHTIDDIFVIQDEITNAIVAVTDSVIEAAEIKRAYNTPTEDLHAWGNFHRGLWYIDRTTLKDTDSAEKYFNLAIKQDSHFARAFAGLSYIHTNRLYLSPKPIKKTDNNFIKSVEFAQRCIDYDAHEMVGYMCLGRAKVSTNQLEGSLVLLEKAISIGPNSPHNLGVKAQALTRLGDDYPEAIACLDKCERLNPYSQFSQYNVNFIRAITLLYQKNYTAADVHINRLLHYNDSYHLGYALAAIYHQLIGNNEKAQQSVTNALDHLPQCTVESCRRILSEREEPRQRFIHALLEAGMPSVTSPTANKKVVS